MIDQVQMELVPIKVDDLLGFSLSQNAIIDKDGIEFVSDGFTDQGRHYRRIDPTADRSNDLPLSNLASYRFDGFSDKRLHRPGGHAPADIEKKIPNNILSQNRMMNLRVKLEPPDGFLTVPDGTDGRVVRFCNNLESLREGLDPVTMTHPYPSFIIGRFFESPEQVGITQNLYDGGAIFPSV